MSMAENPTRIIGYSTAAVTAIIGLLVAFGVDVSDEQRTAILTAIGALVPIIIFMVEFTRSKVVSPAAAGAAVAIAKKQDPTTNVVPEVKVDGFKEAAADVLGKATDEINWRPPVEAH